jgi:flavodoxin I
MPAKVRMAMKALVVFDSVAGNTEKVAQAIAAGMAGGTKAVRIGSPESKALDQLSLLVVGSPTYGGKPTETVQSYLDSLPAAQIKKLRVAAFDTRLKMKLVKVFGFASDRMTAWFKKESGECLAPMGFIVKGRNGPLADGELERATAWGKELAG